MFKKINNNKIMNKFLKKVFEVNKKEIIIFAFVLVLLGIVFFIGYKIGTITKKAEEVEKIDVVKQIQELETIKKERGHTSFSEEDIKIQMIELEELRKNAK